MRIKARPWRSIFAALIAIAGAIAARGWGARSLQGLKDFTHTPTQQAIFLTGFAAFVIFGLAAAVGLSSSARSAMQPVIGQAHAGVVRYVVLLAGVFAWLSIVLALVGVPARQLLTAGAVGGVLLGIAAQQSLGNLFAGLVLLFARPFRVGDHVRFRAGALSGTIEGYVTDLSLTYVRMQTDEGPVLLPNAQALAAAVLLVPEPPGGGDRRPAAGCLGRRRSQGRLLCGWQRWRRHAWQHHPRQRCSGHCRTRHCRTGHCRHGHQRSRQPRSGQLLTRQFRSAEPVRCRDRACRRPYPAGQAGAPAPGRAPDTGPAS